MSTTINVCRAATAVVAIGVCGLSSACAQVRSITVSVTVETQQGQAIDQVPVQLITMKAAAFDFTDVTGQLSVQLDADQSETMLAARLWDGRWHDITGSDRILADERYRELRNAYSFDLRYAVSMNDAQDTYAIALVAYPSVEVSGRLLDSQGQPVTGEVSVVGSVAYDRVWDEDAGVFEFGGVRQSSVAYVVCQRHDSAEIAIVQLTAIDTAQDYDMGDIVPPLVSSATAEIDVDMVNYVLLQDSNYTSLSSGVTLVAADASHVYHFPATLEGQIIRERMHVPEELPLVEAGEYYVVPGAFGSRGAMALYLSVLDGRQAQLDSAGVPTITAVANQQTVLQFDAGQAYDDVVAVGGDLW